MIKVIGAKGKIIDVDDFLEKISIFAKKNNIIIQTLDADLVFGKNHILSAVDHALRAIERKTNTTNSLEKEILLYASGERQIKLAIQKIGVKLKNEKMVFVFVNNKKNEISNHIIKEFLEMLCLVRNDNVIEGDEKTLIRFGIKENEIKTVMNNKYADLILEKVALVDIIK